MSVYFMYRNLVQSNNFVFLELIFYRTNMNLILTNINWNCTRLYLIYHLQQNKLKDLRNQWSHFLAQGCGKEAHKCCKCQFHPSQKRLCLWRSHTDQYNFHGSDNLIWCHHGFHLISRHGSIGDHRTPLHL